MVVGLVLSFRRDRERIEERVVPVTLGKLKVRDERMKLKAQGPVDLG